MTVEPFRPEDVAEFLKMATAENWVVEPWECAFLLEAFPEGCFCMRDCAGKAIAFVTSLQHERSGWIGNLIVAEGYRGQGRGEGLFRKAMESLQAVGVSTFWLTASNSGRSLYEKYGFKSLDAVIRWSGNGRQRHAGHARHANSDDPLTSVSFIDSQTWGDRRDALLAVIAGRGQLLLEGTGFIVMQPCGTAVQLGPFSALGGSAADHLLTAALGAVSEETRVYIDAPLSNSSAVRLFRRRGMQITGRTELMYAGIRPAYQPGLLYGLATMGSCG